MILIKGATQVGKTTLCSLIEEELGFNYVSLVDHLMCNATKKRFSRIFVITFCSFYY